MAVVTNSVVLRSALVWEYSKTNTGLQPTEQQGSISSAPTINTTTFNHCYLEQFTLAAAANATKDLYGAWTNVLGESVTAIALFGFIVKVTATVTGGQIKLEDGASNPLGFGWGTGDTITLTVGTIGATIVLQAGTTHTVSNTAKNVKFSNPGTQTVTVTLGAVVGTA